MRAPTLMHPSNPCAWFQKWARSESGPALLLDVRYIRGIYYQVSHDTLERLDRCIGFEWDPGNAPKVVARHGVEPGECEQAFFVEPLIVETDSSHSVREPRWRALGRTLAGRKLHIVFTIRMDLIRVIAARDMSRKERKEYDEAKARIEKNPGLQD